MYDITKGIYGETVLLKIIYKDIYRGDITKDIFPKGRYYFVSFKI